MSIDATAVARGLGITTEFRDLHTGGGLNLPQAIAVFAQGATASTFGTAKFRAYSSKEVGDALGYGSPAHLVARELFPANGDGVGTIPVTFYPMDDDGSGVAAAGSITPSGSQTVAAEYRVRIAGIYSLPFTIAVGASVATICTDATAAINGVLEMPVTAADGTTVVNLTSKWEGVSANDIFIEVVGASLGTAFAVVQPVGGLVDPDITTPLTLVGTAWETMGINALDPDNASALDAIQTWGEGRWGALVKKPAVVFRGQPVASQATAVAVTSTRTGDRVNVQVVAPGSVNLPCVVAAAEVVRIVKMANNNPAHDYGSQACPTLTPGLDSEQWTYPEKDAAVKAGCSTADIKNGVVAISDVVTSWAPTGEAVPAFRYVCDIVKLQNLLYRLDLEFGSTAWDGAPFVPDDQATTNPTAKKPYMVVAAANAILDGAGDDAILSDVKAAKQNTTCVVDPGNPKRWNLTLLVSLGGNSNVKDVLLQYGFYFGGAAA